jgi:hypothetical protein
MKPLLVLCILLFAVPLSAADLTLAWDTGENWATDTTVRIYEKTGTTPVMVGEVLGSVGQLKLQNVVPGVHRYVARAYSPVWLQESEDSNEAATPALPIVPKNLKYSVTITIGN